MAKLTSMSPIQRSIELKSMKSRAYEHWKINPLLKASEIQAILVSESFPEVSINTIQNWLGKWRVGQGNAKKEGFAQTSIGLPKPTWEDITNTAPDINTLASLFFQGVMNELDKRDNAYSILKQEVDSLKHELDEVIRVKDKIVAEFNEKLAKAKIGTLELDQVKHKLFRKY